MSGPEAPYIFFFVIFVILTSCIPCVCIGFCVYMCIMYSNQGGRNGQGFNGMINGQQNPVGFGVPPPLPYYQPHVQATQYNPSAQVGQQGLQDYTSVQVDPNQVMQSQPPSGPAGWGATSAGK